MQDSSKPIEVWYSAAQLAVFGKNWVGGLPTTSVGCRDRAVNQGWPSRVVPGKGGKNGELTQYMPPKDVLNAIASHSQPIMITKAGPAFAEYEKKLVDKKNEFVVNENRSEYAPVDALFELGAEENKQRNPVSPKPYSDDIYIEAYPDVRAASGTGQVAATEQVVLQIAMNAKDYRDHIGVSSKNIKMITNYGDSNTPTINHGDQVMVDTSCTKFIDDAFYVFLQGESLRIKRIKLRLDGSIEVKSDNVKDFLPEIYKPDEAAEFNIVGRVVPFKFGKFNL